uniref:S5 DRBM domain-containing protein n=1 Tax=Chenopodium quinoa TaxID=63459 RepID=A0A803MFP0_CHEQI
MSKPPFSWLSRLISTKTLTLKPTSTPHHHHHNRTFSILRPISSIPTFKSPLQIRHFCDYNYAEDEMAQSLQNLKNEAEREKHREREEKRKAGIFVDEAAEEEEDWMGVNPLIEKLEKEEAKGYGMHDKVKWDPSFDDFSDSDSENDEAEDPEVIQETRKFNLMVERKFNRYQELLKEFATSRTFDDGLKWMKKIDKFEEKHFRLRLEYKVIGELINRFREATGKDKFLLAQKLNRAMRLVEWKETFDPKDPANYGIIHREELPSAEVVEDDDVEREKKGKLLEEEIRDLAEERNSLTEKKRRPMYRKGFDAQLIDMNRTCKVTKGGQVIKYTAIIACGNYNGVVGFAKAKGPAIPIALQKAYEKCFQNLHYIDRYEDHTIAHAVQTTYKKTKVYLWPAKTATGMKAGKTVLTILNLAGFKNVKSKVIGSRNPHNTVKALFQALNAIETPKDVQEKFGRTVVESYLL